MSSISSLLGSIPSLASYLAGDGAGSSAKTASDITDVLSGTGTPSLADYMGGEGEGGDTVSLSAQAQAMLARLKAAGSSRAGTDTASAAQGAGDFITGFLKDAGVDMETLSEGVKNFIEGLNKVVAGLEGATRDAALDARTEAASDGERRSYTLSADDRRLSFTVLYKDKKPASMTVVQVEGQRADTALLTFGANAAGAAQTLNIARMSREYNTFGGLVSSQAGQSATLDLYA